MPSMHVRLVHVREAVAWPPNVLWDEVLSSVAINIEAEVFCTVHSFCMVKFIDCSYFANPGW